MAPASNPVEVWPPPPSFPPFLAPSPSSSLSTATRANLRRPPNSVSFVPPSTPSPSAVMPSSPKDESSSLRALDAPPLEEEYLTSPMMSSAPSSPPPPPPPASFPSSLARDMALGGGPRGRPLPMPRPPLDATPLASAALASLELLWDAAMPCIMYRVTTLRCFSMAFSASSIERDANLYGWLKVWKPWTIWTLICSAAAWFMWVDGAATGLSVGATLSMTYLEAFDSTTPWYCWDIFCSSSSSSPPPEEPRCRLFLRRSKNSALSCNTHLRGRGSFRLHRRFFFLLDWAASPMELLGSAPPSPLVSTLDGL
mmetsp:Transcript_39194/g.83688  ORF Transcript_39194/g.83688 Transcript_39194/m.83688 type:complete len:312 (+) Transcript_39194:693-1628(+)